MKILSRLLTAFDYVALAAAIIGMGVIFYSTVISCIIPIFDTPTEIVHMLKRRGERVIIYIFVLAVGWCALRWKSINKSN